MNSRDKPVSSAYDGCSSTTFTFPLQDLDFIMTESQPSPEQQQPETPPEQESTPMDSTGGDAKDLSQPNEFAETQPLREVVRETPNPQPPQSTGGFRDLQDKKLGEFQILRRLGKGGMAEVYLAEQTSLHRQVALKILREKSLDDEVTLARFEREAKAAANLNHPNIVQVYTIGSEEGIHYIAQEYVKGLNLKDFLARKGPPDVQLALHIMRQVASALQKAAEAGIVHRDIKPENIMITRKGVVKVADFGLAQLVHTGEALNLTQEGTTMGTPLYMSPEQVNGKKLDHRSDIYSLGVTCYHMLAGRTPFQGETALSIAVKHLNEEPRPLKEIRSDLPPSFHRIIHKMLRKDPANRYASPKTLLADLKHVARELRSSTGEYDVAISMSQTTARPIPKPGTVLKDLVGRQSWGKLFFACLVVGLLSAGAGWMLRPGNPLQTPARADAATAKIPRQQNAGQQYFLALNLGADEQAWKAVYRYFPNDQLESQRAKEQLISLYVHQRRFEDSRALCNEFVSQAVVQPDLAAKGYAGLAVIACLEGQLAEAQRLLTIEVVPRKEKLDGPLLALVQKTVDEIRKQTDTPAARDLQRQFAAQK